MISERYPGDCTFCDGEQTCCTACGVCEICDVDLHADDCPYLALLIENGRKLAALVEEARDG